MTKAVDIVLLPGKDLWAELVEVNDQLDKDGIDFQNGCIPHLTLGMTALEEDSIRPVFENVAKDFAPLELKQEGLVSLDRGEAKVCYLKFELNPALEQLHQKVMNSIGKAETRKATSAEFYGEDASTGTVKYLNVFVDEFSGESYDPHITMGYGSCSQKLKHEKYTFTRLAICHLGNHNTCREILYEVDLER